VLTDEVITLLGLERNKLVKEKAIEVGNIFKKTNAQDEDESK
jgi:hypothetical protein